MKSTIQRICELQPFYSSKNTPEMKERGVLVRQELPSKLRGRIIGLENEFDKIFDDIAIEASDGKGRKTEAPWVRIYSKAMSPKPTEGYYLVFHFCADGTAFYLTIGCGSTIWNGSDLRPIPDLELEKRTTWAREVISTKWENLNPFDDAMELGAKSPLTKTFEKATVIAKKIQISAIDDTELDTLLRKASSALNEIYKAQIERRDVSPGEQDASVLNQIVKPLGNASRGQGRGLSANDRKAIELRAMDLVTEHYLAHGYTCTDTSANSSFDILISKDNIHTKVEVKGTTSDFNTSILMTKNEVELHRKEKGKTILAIVSKIKLERDKKYSAASGGFLEILENWDIDSWQIEPITFQLKRI